MTQTLIEKAGKRQTYSKHLSQGKNVHSHKHVACKLLKKIPPTCIHHAWCPTLCPFQWCSQAAGRQWCRRSRLYWCHQPVTGRSTGPGQNQISEAGRDQIRPSKRATPRSFYEAPWHWWLTLPADCDRLLSSYYLHLVVWWGQRGHVPACRRGEALHVCVEECTPTHTEGDLTGDELILSGQARVRCLHPGIKLQKWRFPPIAFSAVELFRGWTEAERHLSTQSVCRAVILKWMNSKLAHSWNSF